MNMIQKSQRDPADPRLGQPGSKLEGGTGCRWD